MLTNAMFGSLEGNESRVEKSRMVKRRVDENYYPPPCLDVFKIKGRIISPSSYLDVLKIKTGNERR